MAGILIGLAVVIATMPIGMFLLVMATLPGDEWQDATYQPMAILTARPAPAQRPEAAVEKRAA